MRPSSSARSRHASALLRIAGSLAALAAVSGKPAPAAAADINAGALLVQANGCAGCHGAAFGGGIGPKLTGIEHRLTAPAIAAAIAEPKAPMPKFPFRPAQIADVVAYLSSLDGDAGRPTATVRFTAPRIAQLSVRFAGPPPQGVTALPAMGMGDSTMVGRLVRLLPAADRHVWRGIVHFSMSGAWTIDVAYGGKHLTVPVDVAGSR